MEGIEKITARIIEDAEREIAQMQRENEEKINALTAEAQAVAEQESLELLTRGRRAAEERRERLSSSAAVECRKMELAAKQELLNEAFAAAVEELCHLPRKISCADRFTSCGSGRRRGGDDPFPTGCK